MTTTTAPHAWTIAVTSGPGTPETVDNGTGIDHTDATLAALDAATGYARGARTTIGAFYKQATTDTDSQRIATRLGDRTLLLLTITALPDDNDEETHARHAAGEQRTANDG